MVAFACTKEDIATEQTPQPSIVNINIVGFPEAVGTRAETTYGKSAWEAGDELLVEYIETDSSDSFLTHSFHTMTYDGVKWSIDTPIYRSNNTRATICGAYICYYPNFTVATDSAGNPTTCNYGFYNLAAKSSSRSVYESEFLSTISIIENNELYVDFSTIDILRNNRIRINYTPNTTIKVTTNNIYYSCTTDGFSSNTVANGTFSLTTDADGNAFIYGWWMSPEDTGSSAPSLKITSSTGTSLYSKTLPYSKGEGDGNNAYVITLK